VLLGILVYRSCGGRGYAGGNDLALIVRADPAAFISHYTGVPQNEVVEDDWRWCHWVRTEPFKIPDWHDWGPAYGFYNFTSKKTGESITARVEFEVRVGVNRTGNGGAYSVPEIRNLRLGERLTPAKAVPETKPLLPGQCVTGVIPVKYRDEQVLARYMITLPGTEEINVDITSTLSYGDVTAILSKEGILVPTEDGQFFNTTDDGDYLLELYRGDVDVLKNGRYGLDVTWGYGYGSTCITGKLFESNEQETDTTGDSDGL
jgi:hypothetical protein